MFMTSLLAECSASGTEEVASPFSTIAWQMKAASSPRSKLRNYRIAMFPYHRNEDEKGLPTRDCALKMAIELRDKTKKCTTEESDTGITFVEKEQPIFND